MLIPQPCAGRVHRNPPTYTHSPSVGMIHISNIIYIQLTYTPQIVSIIYPIQIYILQNVNSPTLCTKGTQKPSNLHSSPKCWHDIFNIIYIQLTYTSQIVGIIYLIQIYILKSFNSPTRCPKGAQKVSNLHSSPKCWHDISEEVRNTNVQNTNVHNIIKSDEGSNSVRMRPENSGASKVVQK